MDIDYVECSGNTCHDEGSKMGYVSTVPINNILIIHVNPKKKINDKFLPHCT